MDWLELEQYRSASSRTKPYRPHLFRFLESGAAAPGMYLVCRNCCTGMWSLCDRLRILSEPRMHQNARFCIINIFFSAVRDPET